MNTDTHEIIGKAVLETLERRQMMSAVSFNDGILVVQGLSAAPNNLTINLAPGAVNRRSEGGHDNDQLGHHNPPPSVTPPSVTPPSVTPPLMTPPIVNLPIVYPPTSNPPPTEVAPIEATLLPTFTGLTLINGDT